KFSDISRDALVFSKGYPVDDTADHINLYHHVSPEEMQSHQAHLYALILSGRPVLEVWPYMRRNRLLCGALSQGQLMGHITLPDMGIPFSSVGDDLVMLCSRVFAMALRLRGAPGEYGATSAHFILWSLLGGYTNYEYLRERVIYPVFDQIKAFRMLWFDPNTLKAETVPTLANCVLKWWHVAFEGGIAVMIDGEDTQGVTCLADQLLALDLQAGSGDCYRNLEDTKKQLELARKTLLYARKMTDHKGLARCNDFRLPALLSFVRSNTDLSSFIHEVIAQIDRFDQEKQTDYLLTLRTYLHNRQNVELVAAKLHVHKNTVFYRIGRIEELFHLDLQDCRQLSTVYYSLLIHDNIV
ncbi:MAG: helix-turn-helix domain-containing protein, partial [Clostridia bacterium]